MNRSRSKQLFDQCKDIIPGGVNSPVRAFKSVGGHPIFMSSAKGAYLHDVDGNTYIDLINSWGPMILGHAHPTIEAAVAEAIKGSLSFGTPGEREYIMADTICSMVPSVEMVRMVNSGTEACMAAIRLARGYTGKNKIIKMEGCYHGHADSFLISAGSGAMTFGNPDSAGITPSTIQDTISIPYNNAEIIEQLFDKQSSEIACVILEPVVGNMGLVKPKPGYLEKLRELCTKHGVLLIFDEVMTGFRLAKGGAQELYNIKPDLSTFGKIIGGGMPVGAYGGKKEIMQAVSPSGKVYQAGTLSGNPVAMAAGIAMLTELKNNPSIYSDLEKSGAELQAGFASIFEQADIPVQINRVGSMFSIFFTNKPVTDLTTAKTSDTAQFAKFFHAMLDRRVYLAPSQFEAHFISTAITSDIRQMILAAAKQSVDVLASGINA